MTHPRLYKQNGGSCSEYNYVEFKLDRPILLLFGLENKNVLDKFLESLACFLNYFFFQLNLAKDNYCNNTFKSRHSFGINNVDGIVTRNCIHINQLDSK